MLTLVIVALAVPLGVSLRDRVDAEVRFQARGQADVVAATVSDSVLPPRRGELEPVAERAGRAVRGRVIIVNRRGRVLSDSAGPATRGADYSTRPEIARALTGESDQRERHSSTLDEDLLATAVPVVHRGEPVGAVRITQSVAAVDRAVRRSTAGLVAVAGLVLFVGLVAGAFIASQMAGPLGRLQSAAHRVSAGDLDARAPVEGSSEQRSLATAFNEMTARLARLLRSQQRFVADASHQLRTPLTGLRLRLEEAEAAQSQTAASAEIDDAMRELDRLSQTIDELLVLSRAGERDAPAEPVRLADTAGRAVARWTPTAANAGVALSGSDDAGATVLCARADLDRVLDALLENAIAYSPRRTAVDVAVRGTCVEVLDRGAGLAEGEEEAVFERFHRGSAGRHGPAGTGLGLAIARELLEQWRGTVTLRRRPGGGTVARVELPRFTGSLPEES